MLGTLSFPSNLEQFTLLPGAERHYIRHTNTSWNRSTFQYEYGPELIRYAVSIILIFLVILIPIQLYYVLDDSSIHDLVSGVL